MQHLAHPITKAEILISLSKALDLVEGQPPGHAARSCLIAMRIGRELGLSPQDQDSLYFASLLKDSGCSNNSARIHKIFGGDDFLAKRDIKLINWSSPVQSLKFAVMYTERDNGLAAKMKRIAANIGPPTKVMDEVTLARCTRGAEIAAMLGFSPDVAEAIRYLDEHWDGKGSPTHRAGVAIPLLSRIMCVAQTLEVFITGMGIFSAFEMLRARTGTWFDPEIAEAAMSLQKDHNLWLDLAERAQDATKQIPVSAAAMVAADADIDQICRAFALIVDAKSSFTAEHSIRVTQYALELADAFGFDPDRRRVLERAALLHDIGKLGVSSHILEKPGKLDDVEFDQVKLHPKYTYDILRSIEGFDRVTEVAANHHERLDGSGYWRGLKADQLDLDMRIVAVADVFDALRAKRPYREALPFDKVFEIMDREAGTGLDADCIEVLREKYATADVPAAA